MNILSIFSLTENNLLSIIFFAVGGLGLFLFGINLMSDSLKKLAGSKLKILIQKTTSNTFKAILVGILITVVIQSSSATTVIVVGLISAGLMTLSQGIGVMLGANIGTTITAFIIGLNVSDYALPIIFVGAFLIIFINKHRWNLSGETILGFGILFLGLEFMGTGLKELANFPFFTKIIETLSNHWILGVFTGASLTALIQSSSAFIGILQKMFSTGTIPLVAAIPILFGSNIGTTVTALIASLSGNRESKQAAVGNLIFKILGTVLFLIFLKPFTTLFELLEANVFGESNMLTLAIVHLIFNVITTFILFFFIKYLIKVIKKIIPDTPVGDEEYISAKFLNEELLVKSPILALESSRLSIIDMSKVAIRMIDCAHKYLNENNDNYFLKCMMLEDQMDVFNHLIHDYLMQVHTENFSDEESINQAIYIDTIRDLERIGDHSVNLVEFFQDRYNVGVITDETTLNNLNYFFEQINYQVNHAAEAFEKRDKKVASQIIKLEEEIDTLERRYRKAQLNAIDSSNILNDIHYVDILSNLERISDHCCNIAENIIDPYYMKK